MTRRHEQVAITPSPLTAARVATAVGFGIALWCVPGATQSSLDQAQTLAAWAPPWDYGSHVPLSGEIHSIEALEGDTPIWLRPGSGRRGATVKNARYPVFGSRPAGNGCTQRWYLIGPQAWLCSEFSRHSRLLPQVGLKQAAINGLRYSYAFVGPDGAFGYAQLSLAGEGIPDSQLEPGFAVALERVSQHRGERYVRTTHGLWIPERDLAPANPSSFQGVHSIPGQSDLAQLAWVVHDRKSAYDSPGGRRSRSLARLSALRIAARQHRSRTMWLQTDAGDWVRTDDVVQPTIGNWPDELGVGERWIDVDLATQILTAFEGHQAVFVTLVSTGRGHGSSPTATPVGEHRVWVKLAATDMTNLEEETASRFYAIEAVPWVMFFKGGYGLHGAFWHDEFGTQRSHGCVNLSLKDAAFLFQWSSPTLQPGWHAVHPTQFEQGTRIRIR